MTNIGRGPRFVVLSGGVSAEREVSLGSGRACALALARHFPTRLVDVTAPSLPAGLRPDRDIVFSTLHGTFGEDGGMQRLLDAVGLHYAGCDAVSSELTFNKQSTKARADAAGVRTVPGQRFSAAAKPRAAELVASLGDRLVFKPNCGGSSVGLAMCDGLPAIVEKLANLAAGDWLVERRVTGRELTVGIIEGRALPVVEIAPRSGIFDYESKYTKGLTEYLAPAPLTAAVASAAQEAAERAFRACGCRDYARIDFMMTAENDLFLLEINTLPGMKETSLLPMGAQCAGLDFTALVRALVSPALERFTAGRELNAIR